MPALDLSTANWRKSTRSSSSNTCVEVAFLNAHWRKSTRSSESNTCVEVAFLTVEWRKSSRSADSNTCVEVAFSGPAVGLRDSKNPTGPILTLPAPALTHLLHIV